MGGIATGVLCHRDYSGTTVGIATGMNRDGAMSVGERHAGGDAL